MKGRKRPPRDLDKLKEVMEDHARRSEGGTDFGHLGEEVDDARWARQAKADEDYMKDFEDQFQEQLEETPPDIVLDQKGELINPKKGLPPKIKKNVHVVGDEVIVPKAGKPPSLNLGPEGEKLRVRSGKPDALPHGPVSMENFHPNKKPPMLKSINVNVGDELITAHRKKPPVIKKLPLIDIINQGPEVPVPEIPWEAKRLSDEEIRSLTDRFHSLGEDAKKSSYLSRGAFKSTFDSGDPGYVIKTMRPGFDKDNELVRDYLKLKEAKRKGLPVETPILVTTPGQRAIQFQKRVAIPRASDPNFMQHGLEAARLQEEVDKHFNYSDIHTGNVGMGGDGEYKIIDMLGSDKDKRKMIAQMGAAGKARRRILDSDKGRIFRSLLPFMKPIGYGLSAAGAMMAPTADSFAADSVVPGGMEGLNSNEPQDVKQMIQEERDFQQFNPRRLKPTAPNPYMQ